MNQTADNSLKTQNSCPGCEEIDSWIYSYEESLANLAKATSHLVHITHKPNPQDLSAHPAAARLKHFSLLIDDNQIAGNRYEQLLDLNITRFGKEQRIVLWNISPEEAARLLMQIANDLKVNS